MSKEKYLTAEQARMLLRRSDGQFIADLDECEEHLKMAINEGRSSFYVSCNDENEPRILSALDERGFTLRKNINGWEAAF